MDEREPPERNVREEQRIGAVPYDETPWGRFVSHSAGYKAASLAQAVCVVVVPAIIVFVHSWPASATAAVIGVSVASWFQWVKGHEPRPLLNHSDTPDRI